MAATVEQRFWAKVEQAGQDDCWLWTGAKSTNGEGTAYGSFNSGYADGKQATVRASRFSYELANGPLPDGMYACHSCDVPLCVNPAHLFAGTPWDNAADRDLKLRHRTHSGERNGNSRITDAQVREIHELRNSGMSQCRIGLRYGVGQTTISYVLRERAA